MAEVSVVIPAYHWKPEQVWMSVKCIGLAETMTDVPFKKVIVETCSEHLKEYADTYIYEPERTTSTRSMNRAFEKCDTQYTVILTNDVFVEHGWLEALLEPFHVKPDCGISTLASYQFNHKEEDKIEEGNWFSVACWKTQGAIFDERFNSVWDDTDFIMRMYADDKRFYRSFKSVAQHLIGATHYGTSGHSDRYESGRLLFIDKWKHLVGTKHEAKYKELAGL